MTGVLIHLLSPLNQLSQISQLIRLETPFGRAYYAYSRHSTSSSRFGGLLFLMNLSGQGGVWGYRTYVELTPIIPRLTDFLPAPMRISQITENQKVSPLTTPVAAQDDYRPRFLWEAFCPLGENVGPYELV